MGVKILKIISREWLEQGISRAEVIKGTVIHDNELSPGDE
jgi:hypothetical protein